MNREEILTKVIDKAIKNGWKVFDFYDYYNEHGEFKFMVDDFYNGEHPMHIRFGGTEGQGSNNYETNTVIFSHDFAKAFWNSISCFHNGKQYRHVARTCPTEEGQEEWQYHLQQMVISGDPIKYLEQFLPDEKQ